MYKEPTKEEADTFIKEMYKSGYEGLDKMNLTPDVDLDQYDIRVTVNGNTIVLPFCADTYSIMEVCIREIVDTLHE